VKVAVLVLAFGCVSARTGCGLLLNSIDDAHQGDRISALEGELERLRREIGAGDERAAVNAREQSAVTERLRFQIAELERELAAARAAPSPVVNTERGSAHDVYEAIDGD
jgi:hypothetical protein